MAELKKEVEKLKRREGERILEDLWCSAGFADGGGIDLAEGEVVVLEEGGRKGETSRMRVEVDRI